ncbi:polymorphic toxin-type HINT domain-containing protein [Paenibacillus chitinolyticus]|uniref:polymorphic toxin-type HINT domain-containing protein n=1 Tax=Paenibacillus chitinolyticus TaxID=79263 RepID=UPI0036729524
MKKRNKQIFALVMVLTILLTCAQGMLVPHAYAKNDEAKAKKDKIQKYLDKGFNSQEVEQALSKNIKEADLEEALTKSKPVNKSKEASSTIINEVKEKPAPSFRMKAAAAGPEPVPDIVVVNTKPDEAPYSVNLEHETISTLSGSLSVREMDMVLRGRNGLNFSLTRSYDSSSAQFNQMASYRSTGENGTIPYEEKMFPIGKGWSWDISSVERHEDTKYLHLAGGGVYKITSSGLEGYPWKDLTITEESGNLENRYVLKSTNGTKQYFNYDGKLVKIEDDYKNAIYFRYSDDPVYKKVLTSISSDVGNAITISYSPTAVVLTNGSQTVTYNKSLQSYIEVLTSVVDPIGRTTVYDYALKSAKSYLYAGSVTEAENPYSLLTGVMHPTGAKSVYKYEDNQVVRNFNYGYNGYYRIKSREDQVTLQDGSLQTYNRKDITYDGDMGSSYDKDMEFAVTVDNKLNQTTFKTKKDFIEREKPSYYYNTNITEITSVDGKTHRTSTDHVYDEKRHLPSPDKTTITKSVDGAAPIIFTHSKVYDDYGNITSSTDPAGVTTTFGYNNNHLLTSILEPRSSNQSKYTLYTWDKHTVILKQVFEGSAAGAKLSETAYENTDVYGNVTQIRNKNNAGETVMKLEYSSDYQGAFPTKTNMAVTDADGNKSSIVNQYEYDAIRGLLTRQTDGNQGVTTYQYDALGRVIKAVQPDNSSVSIQYLDLQNQIQQKDETGVETVTTWNPLGWKTEEGIMQGTYKAKAKYGYDTYGRQTWSEDAVGNRTQIGYDAWNRQNQITYADQAVSRIATDDYNLTQTTTDPEGNIFRQTADKLGRIVKKEQIAPTAKVLGTYQYNFAGNVVASTDANGGTTEFRYDPLGQLTAVINAKKEETKYTYDQLGQMIRITYPDNNTRQKKYDELGRLIQTTDATGKVEKLYYDGNNNQIRATDRNGTELSYVYDARNFLIEKKAPDETIRYAYDLAGRRTRMTDNTGTTQYTYQPSTGQLSKVVYPDGKTLAYDYNALGLRSSLNDPSGQNTYYQYDSRNRLSSISSSLADEEAAYSYYRNDLIKQTKQRNGITTAYTYNGLQLQTLTHKQADGTALNTYAYEYDANENETAKTENGQTYQFGYDPLNRITSSSQYRESYAYDARGNRISFQTNHEVNSPDADYVYDKKDRLSTVKLKDGSTVSYKYNGDGLLYERTDKDGTARYYYDGDQVIAEGDGSGSLKTRYVRGRELVARESGGSKAYYLHNGHGDVVELRSGTGTRLNQYVYDIWGNPTVSEENISNPFRYSGEYWDSATKLQYLRARWYDPSMGRFINEDTYEGQLDNPLSLNLYTYVLNNPLKYRDPSGHIQQATDNYEGSFGIGYHGEVVTNPVTDAMADGVLGGMKAAANIVDYLFVSDIMTLVDPNSSKFDKTLAAAGFIPVTKILKGGKILITLQNGEKKIERAVKYTDDNWAKSSKIVCNCFVGGTKVLTDEGEKNIEDIKVGDMVLAKSENNPDGELAYKEVTALFLNQRDDIIKLHVGEQVIETTDNHPFWVEGKGWVVADELQVGDKLQKADGSNLTIDKVEFVKQDEPVTVYNFAVADYHTYYVTDLGIWVHNTNTNDCIIKTGDKTPGGHSFSEHGAQRANERGFTSQAIDNIINNNKKNRKSKVDDQGRKTWEYTDSRGNKVVTNESGGIISVHSPAEGGVYIPKPQK